MSHHRSVSTVLSPSISRVLFAIVAILAFSLIIATTHAYTLLGDREIRLGSSEPGATTTYRPSFDITTPGDVGGIVITFCADSPIINDTNCVAPDNFNLTSSLANLNLGDINLSDYYATTSQHISSGSSQNNTVTLTPKKDHDVESWDTITNNNVSLPGIGHVVTFSADDNILVLGHSDSSSNNNFVTFVDSSDPNPANWTEITNNNVSLSGTSFAATFTTDNDTLVLAHGGTGNRVTFVDASDNNPANWTIIANANVSLDGTSYASVFSRDSSVLVLGHAGGDHITFVDSSDPNPANWTEITNNILLPNAVFGASFNADDSVLALAHGGGDHITFVDSSDPNPANWTEITNNNVSLPGFGYDLAFNNENTVLVIGHSDDNHVTFVDSSDPNPANWTEITNTNVSLAGNGWAVRFSVDENVLVFAHAFGNRVTFVDSSDPNPANWTEITNNNVSLLATGYDATFTADDRTLILGHQDGNGVTFVDSSAILGYEAPVSALAGDTATFELLNARNPSSLGTFYARIYTYAEPTHALGYTLANPSAGGSVIDAGGIALSTAQLLTIESRVQERLTFCLFTSDLSDPNDYETCSHAVPDIIALGDDNGVLATDRPSISKDAKYNITTNASLGATVRMKGTTLRAGSFSIDPVGDLDPGDGIAQGSSPGTEQFGLCIYTDPSSIDTTMTPLAPYNDAACQGTTAGQAANNDNNATFAFNEAGLDVDIYGDAVALKPAGSWSTGRLVFLANISDTTEPGIYSTTFDVIATGRY